MRAWLGFMRRIGFWPLILGLASAGTGGAAALAERDFDWMALQRIANPPLGLPPVPLPSENPPTARSIELGRKLFFDRRLSRNGTMSCAMCHIPEQGFTNNETATPIGVEGRSIRRNAPTIFNVAYMESMFHDGRDPMLETQVLGPLVARAEMANASLGAVLGKVKAMPDYAPMFQAAFGAGPSIDRLGQAIASWERSILSANSAFDRWFFGGQRDALSVEARRGFELFTGDAGCSGCHLIGKGYALFTDNDFHNTGIGYRRDVAMAEGTEPVEVEIAPGVSVPLSREAVRSVGNPPEPDGGRIEVTERPEDKWRFKTPSLRNVALTAPYMHDGSFQTLESVVRYYNYGGEPHDGLDKKLRPLDLDDADVAALVAFLESLTGDNVGELVADARQGACAVAGSENGDFRIPQDCK
jgi:cytochrome c peroxidase